MISDQIALSVNVVAGCCERAGTTEIAVATADGSNQTHAIFDVGVVAARLPVGVGDGGVGSLIVESHPLHAAGMFAE